MSNSIEIKRNKNQLPVPCIDGVALHSVYDPIKESEQIVEKFLAGAKNKTNVLVLGLGFAYHIEALINYYVSKNIDFNIVVIEPNQQIINSLQTERKVSLKNTTIVSYNEAQKYYQDNFLIDFLFKKPAILKHETSFAVFSNFYTEFLSYKGEKNISNYINDLSPKMQSYFNSSKISRNQNITDYCNNIKNTGLIENSNDFLIWALDELIKTTKHVQQGK